MKEGMGVVYGGKAGEVGEVKRGICIWYVEWIKNFLIKIIRTLLSL